MVEYIRWDAIDTVRVWWKRRTAVNNRYVLLAYWQTLHKTNGLPDPHWDYIKNASRCGATSSLSFINCSLLSQRLHHHQSRAHIPRTVLESLGVDVDTRLSIAADLEFKLYSSTNHNFATKYGEEGKISKVCASTWDNRCNCALPTRDVHYTNERK